MFARSVAWHILRLVCVDSHVDFVHLAISTIKLLQLLGFNFCFDY